MLLLSTTCYTTDQPQEGQGNERPSTLVKLTNLSMRLLWLQPLRRWLSELEISDRNLARVLCRLIPAQCPFARTVTLFGRTLFSIPPLCKLNPFYEELVALRFRALCYLAEVLGEDISRFC